MPTSTAITIDATHFAHPKPTGVERYVDELLPLLTKELQSKGASVAWVGHNDAPEGMPPGVSWLRSPYRRFWSQTGLAKLLHETSPDLFFTPSGIAPLRSSVKSVCTVHDLGVYAMPAAYGWSDRLRLSRLSELAAKKSVTIIVPSHFTARQVTTFWKIAETTINVIPEGYSSPTAEPEPVPQLTDMPFFLYVGRLETKKNLSPVIDGFTKLLTEHPGVRLVLAGSPGYGYGRLHQQISKLPQISEAQVIEAGYVTEGQKAWLYAHALAGIIPCPIEGFGLPVLDCFAANLPAICAQAGGILEVGADACTYAQAESPTDWYLQMRSVLNDEPAVFERLKKGANYYKKYTWEATAKQTALTLLAAI